LGGGGKKRGRSEKYFKIIDAIEQRLNAMRLRVEEKLVDSRDLGVTTGHSYDSLRE
jgi:hypothetical protein